MKKLRVITPYTDKELNQNMVVGFEFETSYERAKVLIDKDFCIEIDVVEEVMEFESLKNEPTLLPLSDQIVIGGGELMPGMLNFMTFGVSTSN